MSPLWLHRNHAPHLLVVFGGWALGPAPFAHLRGEQDVLFFDDWRSLPPAIPALTDYAQTDLLAFSFGVAAAGHWLATQARDPFRRKVAVNGTLSPCDPLLGIPPEQVQATADQLSAANLRRFASRAGAALPDPSDQAALAAQLQATINRGPAPPTRFDRIWLSSCDRIFPPQAMTRAWQHQSAEVQKIDAPHSPFAHWQEWEEIFR